MKAKCKSFDIALSQLKASENQRKAYDKRCRELEWRCEVSVHYRIPNQPPTALLVAGGLSHMCLSKCIDSALNIEEACSYRSSICTLIQLLCGSSGVSGCMHIEQYVLLPHQRLNCFTNQPPAGAGAAITVAASQWPVQSS